MNYIEQQRILSNIRIGFEFEFFSRLHRDKIAEQLGKQINRYVVVPYRITSQTKKTIFSHSEFQPSGDIFKLEVDGSGGKNMVELVTSPMKWTDGILCLGQILKWIEKNGWTTKWSGLHFSVSFSDDYKAVFPISGLNIAKFSLGYNEDYIYERFPSRRGSIFARSIKDILIPYPYMVDMQSEIIENVKNIFSASEKYYGVNFSKISKGYVEFRYLGGKGYETQFDKIQECIEYSCMHLYNNLVDNRLSATESETLQRICDHHNDGLVNLHWYEYFLNQYPDIRLTVDLHSERSYIDVYWSNILRPAMYEFAVKNGITQAEINYDSELGKFQLRNAKIRTPYSINWVDLIQCELAGVFTRCNVYGCTGSDVLLNGCEIHYDNEFTGGKIENSTFVTNQNRFTEMWIFNGSKWVQGEFIRCVSNKKLPTGNTSDAEKDTKETQPQ
jgi:hypothetical protein